MKFSLLFCVFMLFWPTEEQSLIDRLIPSVDETGVCLPCRTLLIPGHPGTLLQLPRLFTRFTLYTNSPYGGKPTKIRTGNHRALTESGFDPSLPLKVIIHGWQENPKTTNWNNWIQPLRDTLLNKEPMNVLVVDWSVFARRSYFEASSYTDNVGSRVADFLKFIQRVYPEFNGSQIHLIGFSMGAHVSGVVGSEFPGIARITGLDPAGPNFECRFFLHQLDPSDALFVDNIHTNSGCSLTKHIGFRFPHGHQDFYVNGGAEQPGCSHPLIDVAVQSLQFRVPNLCHHSAAVWYFMESIRMKPTVFGILCRSDKDFKRGKCQNNARAHFGYYASPIAAPRNAGSLTFYLDTQMKLPEYI